MENCVAPGLDEFDVIIRSCIVFSQSTQHLTLLAPQRNLCLPFNRLEIYKQTGKFMHVQIRIQIEKYLLYR